MYDRSDASLYDHYAKGVPGDVPFYVDLATKSPGEVLEIGCGTGRITIPIAESGTRIVALDRARSMLGILKEKSRELDPEVADRIETVRASMENFRLDRTFHLILIPFRAFMHALSSEAQLRTLQTIRRHLKPEGRLVFNQFDPSLQILVDHQGPLGGSMKLDSEFIHPETGHRVLVWDTRNYDLETQILEQYFIFEEYEPDGHVLITKRIVPLTLRYTFRYEMEHLLHRVGLKVDALRSDFEGSPFEPGGEQVWFVSREDAQ